MLKVVNPYNRETTSEDSVAFRAPCTCNSQLQNYTAMRNAGPGCNCSCIGSTNAAYNYVAARD